MQLDLWPFVPPKEHAFVVNGGDLILIWSNGRFISTLHDVVSRGSSDRISAPNAYLSTYDCTQMLD